MRKINWPIAAIILSNIIWGATPAIMKLTLETVPVFFLAFIRFLIACLVLYPFLHKKLDYSQLKNKYLWIYALCGVTGNIALFFLAIKFTTSINASLIGTTGPVFILIFSALILREKIKTTEIVGMILAFLGIVFVIAEPIATYGLNGHLLGNFLMIIATLGAVAATLAGRKFLNAKNTFTATYWIFFIGMLSFLPMAIIEFINDPTALAAIDSKGVMGIVFGGFFASILAYGAHNFALSKLPAHEVSIFTYMDPVVAVLIAIPLLGEKITPPFIIGSVLIFTGILIAEHRIHYHPLHKLVNK